jgi:uncharacterized protein
MSLRLTPGDVLRITDPKGEQVADVVAFSADYTGERFSTGRTIDYAKSVLISTAGVLYSNRSRPMLTILADRVGRHDVLLTPCSEEMFGILYAQEKHVNCLDNLASALAAYGIGKEQIAGSFNAFMNVTVAPDGRVTVEVPKSRAGDYVELRAEMELIVAVTACASEATNNGSLKPIDVAVTGAI